MHTGEPIRICIRGMSGMLGNRLAICLDKQKDMTLTAGIVRNGVHLDKILNGFASTNRLPEHIYLDAGKDVVKSLNKSQSRVKFEHIEQLNLSDVCDIVIDTTPSGNGKAWRDRYAAFGKYVVFQSGAFPDGSLITPPYLIKDKREKFFRQGNCIISALSPIFYALDEMIESAKINVIMQYTGKLLVDIPTNQRIHSTYLADELFLQMNEELGSLFPYKNIRLSDLYQVPSLDYYSMSLHLVLKEKVTKKNIRKILMDTPRIFVTPDVITSTYEIDHFLREQVKESGNDLPPITVYGCDLADDIRRNEIVIRAAIYSRTIAVLPNIDAIRMLVKDEDPIEAMRRTDTYAGFS
ncbi:hypothetical protein Nit79A3_0299 [Nitrosomonas sp. Is79A3]|uniref:hypothetical protein n=1 Tax=Nitrosomonas sp. (strain Is79A3) TaxID=261292 RepID=UPI000215D278